MSFLLLITGVQFWGAIFFLKLFSEAWNSVLFEFLDSCAHLKIKKHIYDPIVWPIKITQYNSYHFDVDIALIFSANWIRRVNHLWNIIYWNPKPIRHLFCCRSCNWFNSLMEKRPKFCQWFFSWGSSVQLVFGRPQEWIFIIDYIKFRIRFDNLWIWK